MPQFKTVVLQKIKRPQSNWSDKDILYSKESLDVCRKFNLDPTTQEYFVPSVSGSIFNSLNFKHFPNMNDVYARDPDALARFLTHWKVWERVVVDNQPYLIVDYNAYQITEIPENISDMFIHALHLSVKSDHPSNVIRTFKPTITVDKDGTRRYTKNNARIEHLDYAMMKENFIPNLVAYMINPYGVVRLAKFIQREGVLPIDIMLNGGIINLQFTTMPYFTKNIE
jgi:hypothetical protein